MFYIHIQTTFCGFGMVLNDKYVKIVINSNLLINYIFLLILPKKNLILTFNYVVIKCRCLDDTVWS